MNVVLASIRRVRYLQAMRRASSNLGGGMVLLDGIGVHMKLVLDGTAGQNSIPSFKCPNHKLLDSYSSYSKWSGDQACILTQTTHSRNNVFM